MVAFCTWTVTTTTGTSLITSCDLQTPQRCQAWSMIRTSHLPLLVISCDDLWLNPYSIAGWWFQTWLLFSIASGMSSFPLTNSYFSRWLKPPTRYVVKTIEIHYPFGNALYHLSMGIWGMVYHCFSHIITFKPLIVGDDLWFWISHPVEVL